MLEQEEEEGTSRRRLVEIRSKSTINTNGKEISRNSNFSLRILLHSNTYF